MLTEEERTKIRSIENEIDNYYRQYRFINIPTSIALQYLLIVFEYRMSFWKYRSDDQDVIYHSKQALFQINKQALMESMNWLDDYQTGDNYQVVTDLDVDLYNSAEEFFDFGDEYHAAVSAFTMWSRGMAEAHLINERTVHFKYDPEQIRYDVLDLKLANERSDRTVEMRDKDINNLRRVRIQVQNTIKKLGDNEISYSTGSVDRDDMMSYCRRMVSDQMKIPDEWSVFGYKADELRLFWSSLMALGLLHIFAVYSAFNNYSFRNDLLANIIMTRPIKDFVRQLSGWTGLSKDKILGLLNLHVYSTKHSKPDVVLTPFVKISDLHVAIAPSLLTTNNLSRNFVKHLAKNYKDEFDSNSNAYAYEMIKNIKSKINKENLKMQANINLPHEGLPDIDVCLIDEIKREIMICECKWTIPPADPYEIGGKIQDEKAKLSQINKLKNYVLQNKSKLAEFVRLDKRIEFKSIFFLIVFENHVGLSLTFDEITPHINSKIFVDLINKMDTLSEAFEIISTRSYLPEKDRGFMVKEEVHQIGDYKLLWTHFHDL